MAAQRILVYVCFFAALVCNTAFWFHASPYRTVWANVPPAPTDRGSSVMALGDRQFAYRVNGIMLQNAGNMGGRSTPLKDYDYRHLGAWFRLADKLDPQSVFMPFLAAYYFGAAQEGTDISSVIDYLEEVGLRPGTQNWRWLAQAVFLARYRMNDLNHALDLAGKLSAAWEPGRPAWMKQMQAFIMMEEGDRNAAAEIIISLIRDEGDRIHPEEVNSLVVYLCTRVFNSSQAAVHPLCTNIR